MGAMNKIKGLCNHCSMKGISVISKRPSDISVTKWVMLKSISVQKAVQVSKQGVIQQANAFELL